jgi:hypothetical protein
MMLSDMRHVEIDDWTEFADVVKETLIDIGHQCSVIVVRNFDKESCDELFNETDRLAVAISTGTDRDADSTLWNATGHDYEHDTNPSGKRPDEIIYAYAIDVSTEPFSVRHSDLPDDFDIVENLDEYSAVLVYDSSGLDRKAKNEYWFNKDPRDALLIILTLRE